MFIRQTMIITKNYSEWGLSIVKKKKRNSLLVWTSMCVVGYSFDLSERSKKAAKIQSVINVKKIQ